MDDDLTAWAIEWRSENRLDGRQRGLTWPQGRGILYDTRRDCREAIKKHYGYIRQRPDLRAEPHGWRMPVAVRVEVRRVKRGR